MSPEAIQAMCESKTPFASKKDALTARNARLKSRRNRPETLRAYDCPVCGKWHLTHKP